MWGRELGNGGADISHIICASREPLRGRGAQRSQSDD